MLSGARRSIWAMPRAWTTLQTLLPGLALALVLAAAASFVSSTYGGPTMLLALLLGIAFNFTLEGRRVAPGIQFVARRVLRLGVALLGLQIAVHDVLALGAGLIEFLAAAILATILTGLIVARLLRQSAYFGTLIGGATAICGASAALAIASVLPPRSEAE